MGEIIVEAPARPELALALAGHVARRRFEWVCNPVTG
jgi:hypothetical protein